MFSFLSLELLFFWIAKTWLSSPRPEKEKERKRCFLFENLFSFSPLWGLARSREEKASAPLCSYSLARASLNTGLEKLVPQSTFRDRFLSPLCFLRSVSLYFPQKRLRWKTRLGDGERVVDALGIDLGALEPALVADGDVGDVQVAAGDGGGDEVVAV